MTPRTNWIIILCVLIALIAIRMSIGQGMGRAYIEPTKRTVEAVASADGAIPAQTITWNESRVVQPNAYFAAQQLDSAQTKIVLSWPNTIGLWLAAFFTLAIFSFMYRDNPGYRLAEAVIIGVSAAYWMVIGFWDVIVPKLLGAVAPTFVQDNIIPTMINPELSQVFAMYAALILGIMLLMRLSPVGTWISMWPLAFIVGVTAGLKIVSHVESDLMQQTAATFKPLIAPVTNVSGRFDLMPTIWASLANILVVVGVLCCLTYFFFSVEHKGAVGRAARVGIWYLMITFGAAFGFTVMGRVALLAARMEFLFDDWLWLIDPAGKRIVETLSMLCWW